MNFQNTCLGPCNPKQVVNITNAINDISTIHIYCDSIMYDTETLEYAYSIDNVCWSCYMSYSDALKNTIDLTTDFYVRIKVNGKVDSVTICDIETYNYKCSIAQGFEFSYCSTNQNSNLFNPYINMDCAIALQQQLTENVSCMFGIPIYYIKLTGDPGSKDITFKEYTLLNVKDIKQIKMLIMDNQMPSSKPEFSDLGFDWQTDWECEIAKGMFATAFGPTAQPMEGDLVYVPMMKRMWMLTGAYEEKKDALMWNATTFKITLVKYQEKGSVDLGDAQDFVDSLVKNKYEDLFGTEENVIAQEENVTQIKAKPNNVLPIFESDSLRKLAAINDFTFVDNSTYHKNTLISDCQYVYTNTQRMIDGVLQDTPGIITYQRTYCGDDGVLAFILTPAMANYTTDLITLGSIKIRAIQEGLKTTLKVMNADKLTTILDAGTTYLIYLRWNRMLNTISLTAAKYTHDNVPTYILKNQHYWYDIDRAATTNDKYNMEFIQSDKVDLNISMCVGAITNIKLFTQDNDNVSEIMQMFPSNANLIINDTARRFVKLNGI